MPVLLPHHCLVAILGLSFAQRSPIAAKTVWPSCLQEGLVFRHNGINGIFLDLTDVGAKEGCWQEDCTKTDKFVCPSPAECAMACTHIEVCKFWTYEPGIRKCFLRSSDAGREANPDFVSGARDCNPHAGSAQMTATRVAVPFARAALWAAELQAIRPCDTGIGTPGCDNPYAAMAVWRYAINNLRLAVNGLPEKERIEQREVLQYIQQVAAAIAAFYRQPTAESFQVAVTSATSVFSALQGWLQAAPGTEIEVPPATPAASFGAPHGKIPTSVRLANGREMPLIGFGTWQILGQAAYDSTLTALRSGYRHIDTAQAYMNEREVGLAIRDSGVPRAEIFLATKCSEPDEYFRIADRVEAQLAALGTDYLDLYMLHTPEGKEAVEAAWRALEQLHARGKVRSLGVSNFGVAELEALLAFASIKPVYVQNKFSVYNPGEQQVGPSSVLAYARNHGMQLMGYSLMNAWPFVLPPMEDPHVREIAARYQRSPAQVLNRWTLQQGVGVLARSTKAARIEENARILDFELSDLDMRLLGGLVTLSESLIGAPVSPVWADDVYSVGKLTW